MSDNTTITAGSGTTVATDLIGGVHFQRTKMVIGADGVAVDVSDANPLPVLQESSDLAVTVTAAAAAAATLTLPAPGAGLFHHIRYLQISLYSNAARTGAAAPWIVTTTNLPGSVAFDFTKAGAIGTIERMDVNFSSPLKSSVANTATTFVAPAATAGIWRLTAAYYTGS